MLHLRALRRLLQSKDGEEDKDEDMEETDEDRWDAHRGRHASKERIVSQSAPTG
jgi:hypothetical protein